VSARVPLHAGLLAEYATSDAMLAALRRLRALGYERLDAFTPYPVKGVDQVLALPRSRVPRWVLALGLLGAGGAYFLQWWMNAYNYPINVGGRPPHSALAFVPITFEMGVLAAGITAFVIVFVLGRLTALDHPIFAVEGFERASIDRFWIGVDVSDPRFDRVRTGADLQATGPLRVAPVGGAP
jgi:hypothetical protein